MAADKRGLGRGIDTLFRNSNAAQDKKMDAAEITKLPLNALIPCPTQPRKIFEERPLEELAESIRNQGIIQPLLVRPHPSESGKYEIVAGERRFRAATLLELAEVPVCVRHLTDTDALTAALVENLQREDLNPLEEAQAMQALRDSLDESQDALAARLGKSRSAVANTLRLLNLPEDMRAALADNIFTPGHARAVLSLQDENLQRRLFEAIVERQLTVRDAENAAQHLKRNGELPESLTGEIPATPQRSSSSRAPKPELVRDIQKLLRAAVHPKVSVNGTGDLGRITIPYDSADALADLLRKLGGEAGPELETLESREILETAAIIENGTAVENRPENATENILLGESDAEISTESETESESESLADTDTDLLTEAGAEADTELESQHQDFIA